VVDINNYIWINERVQSVRNSTRQWPHAATRNGITNPVTPIEGVEAFALSDFTQLRQLTYKQHIVDFQVPTITLEFLVNGVAYFDVLHSNNDLAIKRVNLDTFVGNFGAPPLVLNKGETFGWRIVDGPRLNASDIVGFRTTVWGTILGYNLP